MYRKGYIYFVCVSNVCLSLHRTSEYHNIYCKYTYYIQKVTLTELTELQYSTSGFERGLNGTRFLRQTTTTATSTCEFKSNQDHLSQSL